MGGLQNETTEGGSRKGGIGVSYLCHRLRDSLVEDSTLQSWMSHGSGQGDVQGTHQDTGQCLLLFFSPDHRALRLCYLPLS
jgi:hypothetical protein